MNETCFIGLLELTSAAAWHKIDGRYWFVTHDDIHSPFWLTF